MTASAMTQPQIRSELSWCVPAAWLAGLFGVLLGVFGAAPSLAQETGANGSEAVIEQVPASSAPTTVSTKIPQDQLLQTVLRPLQTMGPDFAAFSENGPLNVTGQRAIVRQDGVGNTATVDQRDASNVAAILQRGNFNDTRVVQRGRSNAAGIVIDGNNNRLDVLQRGVGNRYLIGFRGDDLGGSNGRRVSQQGTNNILVEVGQTSMPFNIRQQGNGMRMFIRHSGNR
jgi:hypothetical protein